MTKTKDVLSNLFAAGMLLLVAAAFSILAVVGYYAVKHSGDDDYFRGKCEAKGGHSITLDNGEGWICLRDGEVLFRD